MRLLIRYLFLLISITLIAACAGKSAHRGDDEFDPEKSFAEANRQLEKKEFDEARAIFLEIKNRDNTKKFAPLAQLRIADSYIKSEEPDRAIEEYKKFIELYPDHRNASYAQYQIAMTYFNEIESPERGYGGAARALAEFEKLKKDYPRNPYREVIDLKIEKCRDVIADYEFMVGEYYMKKGSYEAAIGRFEGLLQKYPDFKKNADLLLDLAISHKKSGRPEKAGEYHKQLLDRYPNSKAAAEAGKLLPAGSAR